VSESKKPTPEELWERAGYLDAAADTLADAARAHRAYNGPVSAYALPVVYFDAYLRGRERWYAEHPEVEP
jgi:hypothetical protein